MNNKIPSMLMLILGLMCVIMFIVYMNFQADKPKIIAEQQQQKLAGPGDIITTANNFIHDMSAPLTPPPVQLPTMPQKP